MSMVHIYQPRAERSFEGWKIPGYGEDPPEGMVEWLSAAPSDTWDGDDFGITVLRTSGESRWYENGEPGDYIVWDKALECLRILKAGSVGPNAEFRLA